MTALDSQRSSSRRNPAGKSIHRPASNALAKDDWRAYSNSPAHYCTNTFSRHALRIVGAASTHASVCASRRQWCLAPLPWDLDVSAFPGSDLRLQGARGLSIVPLRPTISNCVHGRIQRVGGSTFPYSDSPLSRSWLLPVLVSSHHAGPSYRFDVTLPRRWCVLSKKRQAA